MASEYEGRLRELETGWAQVRMQHASAAAVLVLGAALILVLSPYARAQHVLIWWLALLIPVGAIGVRRFRLYQAARARTYRLKKFYSRGIQRAHGEWAGQGIRGDEFHNDAHLYARDLGIFGEGSLFELLCIARTGIGRRRLAAYLLEAPATEETLARQEAVRELEPRTELREAVALLGDYESAESRAETFEAWLDAPAVEFPNWLPVLACISALMLVAAVAAGLLSAGPGLLPWLRIALWIWPMVVFHVVVGLWYRRRVNRSLDALRSLAVETRVVREGLRLLETREFQTDKLVRLAGRVRHASRLLRRLEWLLGVLNQRDKDGFYFPSRLLLGGTQVCMAVEAWRRRHGAELREWLAAWGEFEALNALANYAHENPGHTYPEFADDACYEGEALGHPLLPDEICVRNELRLNDATRFYVISGSNMSGKSTLMRAIGLNAVLGFAGAPVRARRLRMSGLSVCASISVVDSLLQGRSKFMAEVERLRQTIEAGTGERRVLFLIDEILSGTNSRDRRVAAEAVVRTLVNGGAIGALSTHDMSLTEIAGVPEIAGENVHMGARADGGPMDFDYLLKPGPTTETNALAIARMAGVPV